MAIAAPPATSDDAMILEAVREIVAERVAPRAAEIDERGEFARDIYELFADNDLFGVPFPEEYGGLGLSFETYVKVVEEVSKACASSGLMIAVQELSALALIIAGNEAQKQKYLTKLSSGRTIGAYALTEPGSGSDAAGSMRARAERRGERVRPQRQQGLDHQRQRRRRRDRLRRNRPFEGCQRHQRLHRREELLRALRSVSSKRRWESGVLRRAN